MSTNSTFEILLEKKGRGRGMVTIARPWTVRTFKLKKQSLEYFDRDKLKGTIDLNGTTSGILLPADADGKNFPFFVDTKEEKLLLNASSDPIRQKCIELFNHASKSPNWATELAVAKQNSDNSKAAAVVATIKTDTEVSKLEEEMKRVELERQKQVKDAAAAAMQEELARKELREAKAAKKAQEEQQQREALAFLASLGAKSRMREAIRLGRKDMAESAAAEMLQNAWKGKVARKQVEIKKAERKRKLESGHARKIQSRYRARLAKRRVAELKAQKLALKQKICAMKVQGRWRIFLAKRRVTQKQEEKMAAEYNKSVNRQRGIIKLQNMIRCFIAYKRAAKKRVSDPVVIGASIKRLATLSSDPLGIVSGMLLDLPPNHPVLTRKEQVTDEILTAHSVVTSHYRVESFANQVTAVANSANRMDYLIVTLIDRAKNEFIGQAFVRVSDARRQLAKGSETVDVEVNLKPLLVPIADDAGNKVANNARTAIAGSLTVTITFFNQNFAMCGTFWKVTESLMSSAWKKRWFALLPGELHYYNSNLNLEEEKNFIPTKNVTSLKNETYKGRNCMKITFTVDGSESYWYIDFDESLPLAVKDMWMRRIYRNCPSLVDPSMEAVIKKVGPIKRTASTKFVTTPTGKPKVSKRMSIFS